MDQLKVALKEWNLLNNALLDGTQAILLRKGGILEANNEFELEYKKFLLFPTFVHQDPRMVKPEWRAGITSVRAEPETIEIRGYAEAAKIFEVPDRPAMDKLFDLHIWDVPLIDMRFSYRPEKPLYLVVVRAFRLPRPVVIPNMLEYAGCKSWVPLEQEIDVTGAAPATGEDQIAALLGRISRTFAR